MTAACIYNFCIYSSIFEWICLSATGTQVLPAPMLLHDILIVRYIYIVTALIECDFTKINFKLTSTLLYNIQLMHGMAPDVYITGFNTAGSTWWTQRLSKWGNFILVIRSFKMMKLYSCNTVIHLNWSLLSVTSPAFDGTDPNRTLFTKWTTKPVKPLIAFNNLCQGQCHSSSTLSADGPLLHSSVIWEMRYLPGIP